MTATTVSFPDRPDLGDWALGWEAFDWIARRLKHGKRILELGSGVGTDVLTRHWKVWSVEHDARWVGRSGQATYIHAPLVDGWYDPDVLKKELPDSYDMLIVDGPPGLLRQGILDYLDLFDLSVPVLVDDVQRASDMSIATAIAKAKGRRALIRPSDRGRRFAGID